MSRIPPAGKNNLWYHFTKSDTVFVFVHGVLSDSRSCWLNNTATPPVFWPDLVASDPCLKGPSVYLAGYYTDVNSGKYDIRNCADEVFSALRRADADGRHEVMARKKIVFICHSQGGIIARRIIECNFEAFAEKQVGLVLIGSPSLGSIFANLLNPIAWLLHHSQARQLQWGDLNLSDLDDRFKNLLDKKRVPNLVGVEFYENHLFLPAWMKWIGRAPILRQLVIVGRLSAARYFAQAKMVPNTDHSTIVKPDGVDHCSHRFLCDFVCHKGLLPSSPDGE